MLEALKGSELRREWWHMGKAGKEQKVHEEVTEYFHVILFSESL